MRVWRLERRGGGRREPLRTRRDPIPLLPLPLLHARRFSSDARYPPRRCVLPHRRSARGGDDVFGREPGRGLRRLGGGVADWQWRVRKPKNIAAEERTRCQPRRGSSAGYKRCCIEVVRYLLLRRLLRRDTSRLGQRGLFRCQRFQERTSLGIQRRSRRVRHPPPGRPAECARGRFQGSEKRKND